ncbi:MAG: insulinase family protein [Prevotella sp.]|nr:insulinase family protein [Candidatus Prevotella equi]
MLKNKIIIVLCLLVAFAYGTQAQTHLKKDSAIREGKLANGLTYFIRHNNQTPGQADFYLANRVGSVLEEPQQRGLAHFLEHMAFNGTKHFPYGNGEKGSIRNWCEKNGIKFGDDLNASTSIDQTIFNISNSPVAKAGVADTCLLILRDWSNSLLLRDEEIDKERGVVREEWRSRRSLFATTRMMEEAMPVIYSGSKYEDCLPIGYVEVIDTFHYEALRDFYRKWYRPDLQAVIVVGDIDVDKTEAQIKELFGDIAMPENPAERIYYPVADNDNIIIYTQSDEEQPTLNFSLYMKRDAEPRETRDTREVFKENYKSRMAMFILRQRLNELTKQSPIKIMSVSCRDNSFYITKEKNAFALTINLLPYNPKGGIDASIEVVEKARRYGFTEAELGHAKDQYLVDVEHKRDTKDKTRNGEYVHKILDYFCNGEAVMDAEERAALEAEMAKSVTLEEVNEAIKNIVINKNQACIILGPKAYDADGDGTRKPYAMPTAEQFKAWITEAQQREYADDAKGEQVDLAFMKKMPKAGKILARKKTSNGYTEYLLSNGIRVHVRPSKIEPDRMMVNMFRLGGRSLYTDKDVVSMAFLGAVVKESGAADFDFLTLEKKRRGKALRVIPYLKSEEEGVNGVCMTGDFKSWLEICHLYLTNPRRDEAIFNSIVERQKSILRNRTANPNVVYNDSLKLIVYGKNARTVPLDIERLKEVSIDRIYEIYKERFSNLAGMNLIVTGDVREEDFDKLICQYVASLPGTKPSKAEISAFKASVSCKDTSGSDVADCSPAMSCGKVGDGVLDIRKVNESHVFNLNRKIPSAMTNLVYSADMPCTPENDLKTDMLSQLLRAIYTEKIREEKGGTYGVSIEPQIWKYPSEGCSLTITFRCAPDNYDALMPLVIEEVENMAENGPAEQQLQTVKEYILKSYERAILINKWWENVRLRELREGVNIAKNFTERVKNITTTDIRDFCKAIVDANRRIQVTMK